jgi:hypothetical protein
MDIATLPVSAAQDVDLVEELTDLDEVNKRLASNWRVLAILMNRNIVPSGSFIDHRKFVLGRLRTTSR